MSQLTSPESTIEGGSLNPPMVRLTKGKSQVPSTPKKHTNKPSSKPPVAQPKPLGYPPPGTYTYTHPLAVGEGNRYAPLDNRAPDSYYYEPYRHQYPPRPPRGGFRGNFRGRPRPYYNQYQGGGRGCKEAYRIPPKSPQYPKEPSEREADEEEVERKRKRKLAEGIYNLAGVEFNI